MNQTISLDAHAHVKPTRTSEELAGAGAVLAMTLSLDEAEAVAGRCEPLIAWGVGCHPRGIEAQAAFDADRFAELAERAPFIGEVGLDVRWSRVPLDLQRRTFRAALAFAARRSRPVSIHSFTAARLALDELRQTPVPAPILHWWTGNAAETREAVAMGCYFSVHSAVARRSTFRTAVRPERILVESDHGWDDPPAAIPCRVEWVEHLLSVQLERPRKEIRRLAWRNLATIIRETGVLPLLPGGFARLLCEHMDDSDETGRLF